MSTHATFDGAEFQAEIDRLTKLAATTTDECLVATTIAVLDRRVRERVAEKVKHYLPVGLFCHRRQDGRVAVVFNFECHPDQICLVKPWFAAVVDLEFGIVDGIQDPYRPHSSSMSDGCECCMMGAGRRGDHAVSNPSISVSFSNVHTEGDNICADIHVHAQASSWHWDKDFPDKCVNARVTVYDGDVGPAHVKVDLYPDNDKICAEVWVTVFGLSGHTTKCSS